MNEIQPKATKTSHAQRARRGRLSAKISKVAKTTKQDVQEDLDHQAEAKGTVAKDFKKFKETSSREVENWLGEHPKVRTALSGVGFALLEPRKAYKLAREIAEKTLSRQLNK